MYWNCFVPLLSLLRACAAFFTADKIVFGMLKSTASKASLTFVQSRGRWPPPGASLPQRSTSQRWFCGSVAEAVVQHAETVHRSKKALKAGFHEPTAFDGVLYMHEADVQFANTLLSPHVAVSEAIGENVRLCGTSDEVQCRASSYHKAICYEKQAAGGHRVFRDAVAKFIARRDGLPTRPESVFMTAGSWPAAQQILHALQEAFEDTAVLMPSPGPSAYRETLLKMGLFGLSYPVLDAAWGDVLQKLQQTFDALCRPQKFGKVLIVTNPNMAGQLLPLEAVKAILQLASDKELLLVVEEDLFAMSVHGAVISFRQQAHQMNLSVPILSCFSTFAYTGKHAGYIHCDHVSDDILRSFHLGPENPPIQSQAWVASLLSPWVGQDSCIDSLLRTVAKNSQLVSSLNEIDGIRCERTGIGPYAFPRITIKGYIMKKAISLAKPADQVYCLEMVSRSGVVTSPGSGFGQRPGFFHFRVSLIQKEIKVIEALNRIKAFHCEHPIGWFR